VEGLIAPAKRRGRRRSVNVRDVLNGVMFILSGGCQRRFLPSDLAPRSTVRDYLGLWSWDGTLERIHEAHYVKCRQASPSACIIDSQSVKSAKKERPLSIRAAMMQAKRSKARHAISSSTRLAL
jgi:transposase